MTLRVHRARCLLQVSARQVTATFLKFLLLICLPSARAGLGGVREKREANPGFLVTGPHLAPKAARAKPAVWRAFLEVPGETSQEPGR